MYSYLLLLYYWIVEQSRPQTQYVPVLYVLLGGCSTYYCTGLYLLLADYYWDDFPGPLAFGALIIAKHRFMRDVGKPTIFTAMLANYRDVFDPVLKLDVRAIS